MRSASSLFGGSVQKVEKSRGDSRRATLPQALPQLWLWPPCVRVVAWRCRGCLLMHKRLPLRSCRVYVEDVTLRIGIEKQPPVQGVVSSL